MITPRIEKIRQNYVSAKPQISCQRAAIWTESFRTTEGQPACIRAARAFYDCCDRLGVHIFEGELVVGAVGEFRKCGILTPEFSWMWVDREMDRFATRPQDPYVMTEEQRQFVREKIFPRFCALYAVFHYNIRAAHFALRFQNRSAVICHISPFAAAPGAPVRPPGRTDPPRAKPTGPRRSPCSPAPSAPQWPRPPRLPPPARAWRPPLRR